MNASKRKSSLLPQRQQSSFHQAAPTTVPKAVSPASSKKTIEQRFGVKDIPDGFIFFPSSLGGLEVRNPFIPLLQIRNSVHSSPKTLLDELFSAEREAYKIAKRNFDDGLVRNQNRPDPEFRPANPNESFSLDEYTAYRENLNYGFSHQLVDVSNTLLDRPGEEPIDSDAAGEIRRAIGALKFTHETCEGFSPEWFYMRPYRRWVAPMYGPEMCERFGGLAVAEEGWLPLGVVGEGLKGRGGWEV